MKYKMIVSDFDGTLGKVPHEIQEETVKTIKKYQQQGGIFVICSGRGPGNIQKIYSKHGLNGYLIGCQGSVILDTKNDKEIWSGHLDKESALKIIEEIKKTGFQAVVYYKGGIAYDIESDYVKFYLTTLKESGVKVDNLSKFVETTKAYKINAIVDPEKRDGIIKNFKKVLSNNVLVNSGSKHLVECVNVNCNKGQAVKSLAEYLNIDYKDIMTVGDSTNDIELVLGEWHGVAVGDAEPELKAVAKEITVPFENQPIKELIDKYCL